MYINWFAQFNNVKKHKKIEFFFLLQPIYIYIYI